MIEPGATFYVITTGRRYLRDYDEKSVWVMVGQQLEHAHRFETVEEAGKTFERMKKLRAEAEDPKDRKKPLTIQAISIQNVTPAAS